MPDGASPTLNRHQRRPSLQQGTSSGPEIIASNSTASRFLGNRPKTWMANLNSDMNLNPNTTRQGAIRLDPSAPPQPAQQSLKRTFSRRDSSAPPPPSPSAHASNAVTQVLGPSSFTASTTQPAILTANSIPQENFSGIQQLDQPLIRPLQPTPPQLESSSLPSPNPSNVSDVMSVPAEPEVDTIRRTSLNLGHIKSSPQILPRQLLTPGGDSLYDSPYKSPSVRAGAVPDSQNRALEAARRTPPEYIEAAHRDKRVRVEGPQPSQSYIQTHAQAHIQTRANIQAPQSQAHAQLQSQPQAKSQPQSHLQLQAQLQNQLQSHHQARLQSQHQARLQSQHQAQLQLQLQHQAQLQLHSQLQSQLTPQSQPTSPAISTSLFTQSASVSSPNNASPPQIIDLSPNILLALRQSLQPLRAQCLDHEIPSLVLLKEACMRGDLEFMVLHQLHCLTSLASDKLKIIPQFGLMERTGLATTVNLWGQKRPFSVAFAQHLSRFPSDFDQLVIKNKYYAMALEAVLTGLPLVAQGFPTFLQDIIRQGYPPLIDQLVLRLGTNSPVLHQVLFNACRNLLLDNRPEALCNAWNNIFEKNRGFYQQRLLRVNSSNPVSSQQIRVENQSIINSYVQALNPVPALTVDLNALLSPPAAASYPQQFEGGQQYNHRQHTTNPRNPQGSGSNAQFSVQSHLGPPTTDSIPAQQVQAQQVQAQLVQAQQAQAQQTQAQQAQAQQAQAQQAQAQQTQTQQTQTQQAQAQQTQAQQVQAQLAQAQAISAHHVRAQRVPAQHSPVQPLPTQQLPPRPAIRPPQSHSTQIPSHGHRSRPQMPNANARQPNASNHITSQPPIQLNPPVVASANQPLGTPTHVPPRADPQALMSPPTIHRPLHGATRLFPPPAFVRLGIADVNPVIFGLHESHLNVTQLVKQTKPSNMGLFQCLDSFAAPPTIFPWESPITTTKIDLTAAAYAKLPTKFSLPQYVQPIQGLMDGSNIYQIRCVKLSSPNKTISLDKWAVMDCTWPDAIYIHVNGEEHRVRRKLHHGKDLPVNITNSLVEGANEIRVTILGNDLERTSLTYSIAVEVLDVLNLERIRKSIKNISVSDSLENIVNRITNLSIDSDELAIVDDHLTIDLIDPFTAKIFTLPARAISCSHAECFDLETYLSTRQARARKKTHGMAEDWRCPICNGDARPTQLIMDGFLTTVRSGLNEKNLLDKVKAIKVNPDRTWVICAAPEKSLTQATQPQSPANGETALQSKPPPEIIELE
ncbi:hypothetical protein FQN57_004212 [Myotisia sp. PD_48]|nr:hypothetical protein FQN57_004212 [Myotisia sp. PD_48]